MLRAALGVSRELSWNRLDTPNFHRPLWFALQRAWNVYYLNPA
jgi:hypothetical protein